MLIRIGGGEAARNLKSTVDTNAERKLDESAKIDMLILLVTIENPVGGRIHIDMFMLVA